MKRTFAALLALLLTLAGCGSQPAADGRTVLRLDADGSAVLSDAVRLFNAASADYRVVMDTEAPDIAAGGAGYESSNLVDIMPYVDSGMGREYPNTPRVSTALSATSSGVAGRSRT